MGLARNLSAALVVNALALGAARAQDLEPREYANLPIGLNFVVLGYGNSEGGVATDPSVPLEDAEIRVNGATVDRAS